MNRKSIGEKIGALSYVYLTVSLLAIIITLYSYLTGPFSGAQTVLGLYDMMSGSDTAFVSFLMTTLTGIMKTIVIFFCLRGFGHLLINSDRTVAQMEQNNSADEQE